MLCVVAVAFAKKHHKNGKSLEDVAEDVVAQGTADLAEAKETLDKLTYTKEKQIYNVEEGETEKETGYPNSINNPCSTINCGPGKNCALDDRWNPFCKCLESCPEEETRLSVCSSQNITYPSWCEFHRQKCENPELAEVLVEYYGPCKEILPCLEKEMKTFPRRMREWFSQVMLELSMRPLNEGGLPDDEVDEEREAERDENPFVRPIHWYFRTIDNNPADLYLTAEEMTAIRAPLMRLEHCTKPFFTQCDANKDDMISLEEWGLCLGLTQEEIMY